MDRRRDRAAVAAAYAAERTAHRARVAHLDRFDARLANVRLGLAVVAAAVALASLGAGWIRVWWLLLPGIAFVGVAVVHARTLAAHRDATRRLADVERGLARIEHRWHGHGASGLAYVPAGHLSAEDLDLMGRGSLFDLVSTARTEAGERTLAEWLLSPATPDEVRARQAAVQELAGRPDLRQDLAVLGPDLPGAADTAALTAWAGTAGPKPPRWAPVVLVVLSATTLTGLGRWAVTGLPPDWLPAVVAGQALVGWLLRAGVHRAIRAVEKTARDLGLARALLARVEREAFTAPRLVALRERLTSRGQPASAEIRRLARLVDLLTSRQNQLFGPLSVVLFWATHLAWAIDRWRATSGVHVGDWFAALGELEALAALGTFAAEHPEAIYPEVLAGPPHLSGEGLAHPLLAEAVPNDVALGGDAPHLLVVSGSNMSGKSTFLRTIGLAVVMAQAGAPVCARRLVLSPLRPAATLRVQDSLQSGHSRFFAEITRLAAIVEMARRSESVGTLFLLDELLAGTNSRDRREGAVGVLAGLVSLGAIGVATTHDLALTAIADTVGQPAANAHFADQFADGGLTFDYRLRPGVVETSNALALMRAVGLDV